MKKNALAYFSIATAGTLWGILAIFVNYLSSAGLSSPGIVEIRAFFSVLFLVLICIFRNPALLKIRGRDIPLFLGTGLVSIVLFNTCYFITIRISGVSTAAMLLYTAPAMVMALSALLLKERLTARKILALVITAVGLLFVTGVLSSGETLSGAALLIGLGSGFGYAMYSICGKFLVGKYEPLTITTYTFLVAALGLAPFVNFRHIYSGISSWQGIGMSLGIAAACTVIPFLCYTWGLKKADAGKASIIATVEPLVATVLGVVVYREELSAGKLAGIILILLAIVVVNRKKRAVENR